MIYALIIIISLLTGFTARYKLTNKYSLNSDMIEHYYHMKKYYDNKIFPVTGALLQGGEYIGNPYDSSSEVYSETAKVPGGYFYLEYMFFYFISDENLDSARILYGIAMTLFSCIFLIWIYKKFGLKISAVMTSLIFVNVTFFTVTNRFYNPHTAFVLSFISIPIILEYITSKKLNFLYAVLIFPIIALEAMGHMSAFFNLVPTLIIYLIIRWKNTKKYIVPLGLGVFISFLLYLPYLIYEINNGFPNFMNLIALRNKVKPIIQPPQIWSILFFPTNEPNANYGNTISQIFEHWFKGDITLVFSFIFYLVSIILGISAFIILLKDFFQKKLENENDKIFKETALIYFLYIIVTTALFMILNLGAARARYFINIYPLTFIPIIYLIKKIENKKIFNIFLIFILLNPLAVYIEVKDMYKNSDKEGWNFMTYHIKAIKEDADGNTFDISTNHYYPILLLKIDDNNFTADTNSNIKYHIISAYDTNFNSSNMHLIYSNTAYISYKEYKNNINTN
nr:hypothetical protein [uncultured Brachyspira sp.]